MNPEMKIPAQWLRPKGESVFYRRPLILLQKWLALCSEISSRHVPNRAYVISDRPHGSMITLVPT